MSKGNELHVIIGNIDMASIYKLIYAEVPCVVSSNLKRYLIKRKTTLIQTYVQISLTSGQLVYDFYKLACQTLYPILLYQGR